MRTLRQICRKLISQCPDDKWGSKKSTWFYTPEVTVCGHTLQVHVMGGGSNLMIFLHVDGYSTNRGGGYYTLVWPWSLEYKTYWRLLRNYQDPAPTNQEIRGNLLRALQNG